MRKRGPFPFGNFLWFLQMGVSKNRGTLQWMVYIGKPYEDGWFGGTIIFGNPQMFRSLQRQNSRLMVFSLIFLAPSRRPPAPKKQKKKKLIWTNPSGSGAILGSINSSIFVDLSSTSKETKPKRGRDFCFKQNSWSNLKLHPPKKTKISSQNQWVGSDEFILENGPFFGNDIPSFSEAIFSLPVGWPLKPSLRPEISWEGPSQNRSKLQNFPQKSVEIPTFPFRLDHDCDWVLSIIL